MNRRTLTPQRQRQPKQQTEERSAQTPSKEDTARGQQAIEKVLGVTDIRELRISATGRYRLSPPRWLGRRRRSNESWRGLGHIGPLARSPFGTQSGCPWGDHACDPAVPHPGVCLRSGNGVTQLRSRSRRAGDTAPWRGGLGPAAPRNGTRGLSTAPRSVPRGRSQHARVLLTRGRNAARFTMVLP